MATKVADADAEAAMEIAAAGQQQGPPVPPRGLLPSLRHHLGSVAALVWDSGSWCSALSAFIFAVNSLLVKLLADRVPTTEVVLVRSVISIMFCAYAAHTSKIQPFFGHLRHMHLLFCRGAFGAAAMQTFYFSIVMLPLADAVTLFFFNPTFTTIAAWLILREYLGLKGAGGVLVSLGGLVLLTQPPFLFGHADSWDHKRTLGTVLGLASALFAAGAFTSIRLIGRKEPPLVTSVWFHSVALASSILPLALGFMGSAVWPCAQDCAILFGVGVTSFTGQMVLSRGFQLLPAAKASAINQTQVVWSYFFGFVFMHERVSWLGALGSLLIAAGAVLVNLRKAAPEPAAAAGPAAAVDEASLSAEGKGLLQEQQQQQQQQKGAEEQDPEEGGIKGGSKALWEADSDFAVVGDGTITVRVEVRAGPAGGLSLAAGEPAAEEAALPEAQGEELRPLLLDPSYPSRTQQ